MTSKDCGTRSVGRQAGVHRAQRKSETERVNADCLIGAGQHLRAGCKSMPPAQPKPSFRLVLTENEISLYARQVEIFGGLVAEIDVSRGRREDFSQQDR